MWGLAGKQGLRNLQIWLELVSWSWSLESSLLCDSGVWQCCYVAYFRKLPASSPLADHVWKQSSPQASFSSRGAARGWLRAPCWLVAFTTPREQGPVQLRTLMMPCIIKGGKGLGLLLPTRTHSTDRLAAMSLKNTSQVLLAQGTSAPIGNAMNAWDFATKV